MTMPTVASCKKPNKVDQPPNEEELPKTQVEDIEPHFMSEEFQADFKMRNALAGLGLGVVEPDDYTGMDWSFITKIGNAQFVLSVISSGCLLMSMSFTGFNFLRFTSSAWSTYILCTSYIAIRAGRWHSYAHVVAYTGMVCFQTVVYMSSLCWLVYSLYALDYHINVYRMHNSFGDHLPDLALFLIVTEVISLMGTVFTGVFGLIACCRGFGKLMHQLERMIMEQRFGTTQITLQPII